MAKRELELTRGLKFGVEIELVPTRTVSHEDVANAIDNAGIRCKYSGYTHRVFKGVWKVVSDSSISTDYGRGIEVVSPVLEGKEGLAELEKVVKVLNDIGCKVNKDCGLHIHHDINDFGMENVKNVYRLYYKHMEVLDGIMPESRRDDNNRWCRSINRMLIDSIEECKSFEELLTSLTNNNARSDKRYKKVNLCSYLSYGTIEFRHHSATTNFEKIANWILLTHKIVERAGEDKKAKLKTASRIAKCKEDVCHSSYDLYTDLGINATPLSEYIGKRRKQLSKGEVEGVA